MWGETHVNETLALDEEKTLLGCLLMGGVGTGEVFTMVEARDFQHWAHQAVFAVMQDLFMAGVDIDAISVLGGLEKRGELGRINGTMVHDLLSKATMKSDIPFWRGMSRSVPVNANCGRWLHIWKPCVRSRRSRQRMF